MYEVRNEVYVVPVGSSEHLFILRQSKELGVIRDSEARSAGINFKLNEKGNGCFDLPSPRISLSATTIT